MNNCQNTSQYWTQIVVCDPLFLPGKSIVDVIQSILKVKDYEYIILNEIYGVTKAVVLLEQKVNIPLKIQDLLSFVNDVKQFDWGDFFLFKDYPTHWDNSSEIINYPDLIIQADTTIRAVDDQYIYIYIYTRYIDIVEMIKNKYVYESIKIGSLEELEYPY